MFATKLFSMSGFAFMLPTLLSLASAQQGQPIAGYQLLRTITIPGGLAGNDISWVDSANARYYLADRGNAGEGHGFSPDRDAVPDRLAVRHHVVEKPSVGIDQDRAGSFPALIVDDVSLVGLGNAGPRIRRIGQQLPVSRRKARLRRRCERRLHAAAERKAERPQ